MSNPSTKQQANQYPFQLPVGGVLTHVNPDKLLALRGDQIYDDIAKDEQVKVVSQFRKNSVASREWMFVYGEEVDLPDSEKEFRIEFLTFVLDSLRGSFRDTLRSIMSSLTYGFSLTEKTYMPINFEGKELWGLKTLRTKPWHTFDFDVEDSGDLRKKGIIQGVGGQEKHFDPRLFIHHVHNKDIDEYYGRSELYECFRSWFAKDQLIKIENIYLERLAGGLIWLGRDKESPALNNADRVRLENTLRNISAKTGMLLPTGFQLNLESPTATTAFNDAKSWHDRAIAKALLMPNTLGYSDQGQTGSYAQSKTQLESFLWLLDAEAADLESTINEQLIRELVEFNFADGLAPQWILKPLSAASRHAVVQVWSDLVSKGAVSKSNSDEEHVRELLEFPAKDEESVEEPDPEEKVPVDEQEDVEPDEDAEPTDKPENEEEFGDETIWGETSVSISYARRSKALGRVNFGRIADEQTSIENKHVKKLGAALTNAHEELAGMIVVSPEGAEKAKLSKPAIRKIKQAVRTNLSAGWKSGIDNAKEEVQDVIKLTRKKYRKYSNLGEDAADFFDTKSFSVAGKLTTDMETSLRQAILNGIKFGHNERDVLKNYLEGMASKGLISDDYATQQQDLGLLLQTNNPDARIKTIVRTNTSEAFNEARFDLFLDPDQSGFLEALEYSSILDSRTTDICKHLDGKVYDIDSPVWDRYRPPNHFNCRAVVVAVPFADDVTVETKDPSINPQQGFG